MRAKKAKVYIKSLEVQTRLQDLGLPLERVRSVVQAMVTARESSTENDPISAPGLLSWIYGTRRLREEFLPFGWERDEIDQVPIITKLIEKTKVRVSVMNTDNGTGLVESSPNPRSKKGTATERAASNNQGVFNKIWENANNTYRMPDSQIVGIAHWYLCVYCEEDQSRAELSFPTSFEKDRFLAFEERIIIPLENDVEVLNEKSEFDIPVIRKVV